MGYVCNPNMRGIVEGGWSWLKAEQQDKCYKIADHDGSVPK